MNTDTDTTSQTTSDVNTKQSRIISKVLSPAVRLWLRSQVEQVSDLEVRIFGSDRQILTGEIPRLSISASCAVYQGFYLSQIRLVGENIRINLGQVLRGKELRLVEPVPISGELLLKEADLNASLRSPMFASALTDLLKTLLATYMKNGQLDCHKIAINRDQLLINAIATDDNSVPIVIRTDLRLVSCHELQLQPQLQTDMVPLVNLDSLNLDLGSEVNLQELTLSPGQLICRGRINVLP